MNLKHSMLALALLFGATAAHAEINTIDNVPAATLLAPYFDIDLANANGVRTTLTIGNSTATERLAHVTLWTDMGVPSLNFDVRLDARDTVDIDLRALFTSGTLPTSTAGGFGSCGAFLPPSTLAAGMLTGLRNAHTGAASTLFSGQCGGSVQGDGHARGFVTIDVVNGCSTLFPGDPGYFVNGGAGTARNDNVLWGEVVVSNPSISVSYGDALVHIEADAADALTDGTPVLINHDNDAMTPDVNFDDYTFYARMGATSGADNREALALNYIARFEKGGANATGTHALVWRDPGDASTFACGAPPTLPIGAGQMIAFDQQEEPASEPAARLPLATQSIDLSDGSAVTVPFTNGMITYALGRDADTGPGLFTRNQGYVAHVITAPGNASSVSRGWPVVTADSRYNLVFPVDFPQCDDGIDNDGDGDVDFPDDAQCLSPDTFLESTECSNGMDDDGDTLNDFPLDPGCKSLLDQREFDGQDNQCSDGIDNDGDGQIDWPADPLCSHPFDTTEANQCGDGIDNDMDGLIDFPNDPGCDSTTDNSEQTPACGDGVDNDMDGFTDFPADVGCTSLTDNNETNAVCNDGIDNDMDGNIDFPADTGCSSLTDGDETNSACNDGIDNDMDGNIDFPADAGCQNGEYHTENPACSDGSDNDGDMAIDFPADNSCLAAWSDTESTGCSDGFDNDGDTLIDFPADPECTGFPDNSEYALPECNDDIDNDGDGQIDYPDDPNCTSNGDYFESPAECSDGIDNDGDGDIDFPNSPNCSSPEDRDEAPDCSDNEYESNFPNATPADNDRDGLANFGSDPGCASLLDLNELAGSTTRACSDGIDNDADGFIDFPEDPGCSSAYDDLEYVPGQSIRAPLEPYRPVPTLSPFGLAMMAGLFAMLAVYGLRRERRAGQ